ncbi:response regulator [Granulosicoccus antarcticus]|uniref:Response regulator rcp1 n=1 Tax=Granulosicoccus antarcticus IMCC3135 TaxID=1192854 RepID=A0A2Z2NV07_9GAMM|nr:response regulator [Granulosicoccus antarcticus]ASJ75382.1 Response regulator rcp1 [Granulosicoccus antarcticus IMCC3135]
MPESDMISENTILLVEDDDIDAMMLKRSITVLRPDVKIVRAINGREAIVALATLRPRLIIMDIRMPLMDGRETLAFLKKSEEYQEIPVVMMTTSENPDDIEFCYQHHANAYMSKGIDIKTIRTDISNLLNFWFETAKQLRTGDQ